jgi:hypothetical protein
MSRAALEAHPYLNFHDSACKALSGSTEVTGVGEICVALATRLKRGQVQHIEDVEEVCPEVEGGGLPEM